MRKKFNLIALSIISLGLVSCDNLGFFGDVDTTSTNVSKESTQKDDSTKTDTGKTNVDDNKPQETNTGSEEEPKEQPKEEPTTEPTEEPTVEPQEEGITEEKKRRLLENSTTLNSEGDGYTYLDFNLNKKFKSWDNLIADGDIVVSNNSVTEQNLDKLGKGVLDLKNGVSLGEGALNDNEFIDTLIIPDGEKKVGNDEYKKGIAQNAKSLRKVVLPNTVTLICTDAFKNCTSLEEINFPSSLTKIGPTAFYGTKIKNVDLSNCVNLSSTTQTFQSYKELNLNDKYIAFNGNSGSYIRLTPK